MCRSVVIMYAGRVVELGSTTETFQYPRHPYTAGLISSSPRSARKGERLRTIPGLVPPPGMRAGDAASLIVVPACWRNAAVNFRPWLLIGTAGSLLEPCPMTALLEVRNLSKDYPARDGKGIVKAVSNLSFVLGAGQTLGVVGESGCGKSTLARLIMRLIEPTSGEISFKGQNLGLLTASDLRHRRRDIQMVFQDPYASLDPRMNVAAIISEPLDIHGIGSRGERKARY